jgi:calcium-dependent protein kinase
MLGNESNEQEIRAIIQNIDYEGNGKINYSEFIAATLQSKLELTEEQIWSVFKRFDTDNSGFITEENLMEIMLKSNKKAVTREQVQQMISEVD